MRRAPILESVARWVLLAFFLVVGGGTLVWLGTHDPTYPTVTSSRGNVFSLVAVRQVLSPGGRWAEFDYRSSDGLDVPDDSVAEELSGVLGSAAAQHGDSVLYIVAVRQKVHLGYLWNAGLTHSMRFELHGGTWVRVPLPR